jgi:hypothetical protein
MVKLRVFVRLGFIQFMITGLRQFAHRFANQFKKTGTKKTGTPANTARQFCTAIACLFFCTLLTTAIVCPSASASLQDDRFDGNIFALYAGNGSLVPPQLTLAQSFKGKRPTILTFYIEDSQDCKQFSATVSELQAYYGRAADIIPINVDAIPLKASYSKDEPGYYYSGKVPQTLIFDTSGQKVLDIVGKTTFEPFDNKLREVFKLLPRSESIELKRRPFNEINAELVK